MSDFNWDEFTILRKNMNKQRNKEEVKKKALMSGNYETVKKNTNTNSSKMYKLENEELGKIEKVNFNLGKILLRVRNEQHLSQKELAKKVGGGLNPKIIQEIESGKGKKDGSLMVKIQKALGVKLTGKPETWGSPLKNQNNIK